MSEQTSTTQYYKICLRRGNTEYCNSFDRNKVLLAGEPIFNTDTNVLKIGNGETGYEELDSYYLGAGVKNVSYENNTLTITLADGNKKEVIINSSSNGDIDEKINNITFLNGTLIFPKLDDTNKTVGINDFGNTNISTTADIIATQATIGNNDGNLIASGNYSFAQGQGTISDGEQWQNKASGQSSHVEGENNLAAGERSHAEGYKTQALGNASHTEGVHTLVTQKRVSKPNSYNNGCHAEGCYTEAHDNYAHAEGVRTKAIGIGSHAEGYGSEITTGTIYNVANGIGSHVEGQGTIANEDYQHVSGQFNTNNQNALFIIGNGINNNNRSNALEVLKDGSLNFSALTKTVQGSNITTSLAANSSPQNFILNITNQTDHIEVGRNMLSIQKPVNGLYSGNGEIGTSQEYWRYDNYIAVKENTPYNFSIDENVTFSYSNAYIDVECYDSNLNIIENIPKRTDKRFVLTISLPNYRTRSFTTPSGTAYIRYSLKKFLIDDINLKLQLELGENRTNYCSPIGGCFYQNLSSYNNLNEYIASGTYNALTGDLTTGGNTVNIGKAEFLLNKGENIISTSLGTINLTYKLDPQLIYENFESRIAALE